MAAVKSKSGMCCSSNFEVNMQKPFKSKMSFNIFDICLVVMSMVTFVVDLSTDIFLVVEYFKHGHTYWALSTFLLIVLPAVIVQMFSMRWHIEDETVNKHHWIAHILLVGLLHRYILVLKTGLEARSSGDVSDFQRLYQQQSDICMLHLFESFMESAPQLVLQLYIMVSLENWQSWTGVSATASLASLAWAVAAYTRAMRRARPDKSHVSWPGLICQAMWRGSMVTARITTLVLFAVGFHAWLFLLVGVHWMAMTIWIVFQKTDFCHTPWEEYIYNCVVGVIYCFCFFNLQEGQSRRRVFAFYLVIISQNFGCLGLFLTLGGATRSGLIEVAVSVIVGATILGVASMLLYYRFFHPAGPIKLCSKEVEQESEPTAVSPEKTATIRSLKHRWHTDNNETLTQLDALSPHLEDTYTDKNLLLTHWMSGQTASPTAKCSTGSTDTLQAADAENTVVDMPDDKEVSCKLENEWPPCETKEGLDEKHKRRGIYSPENLAFNFVKEETEITTKEEDEKLRKQKRRGICSLEPEMEVELEWCVDDKGRSPGGECEMEERIRKRRGLCSPDLVGFDIDKEVEVGKPALQPRLSDLGGFKSSDVQSVEGDEVPSDVLSVPSEVLSAHDYENICAVNIAREAWGLRSWRGYSDIETWLHDDSVVRDRRRDTLTSTITTLTSTSSERGEAISPPPLPCRKPAIGVRALRTRQDDYLDTLADDLAVCDVSSEDQTLAEYVAVDSDPNLFVARPYVVDQHGALFPLVMLDTIMEEIEESSISTDNSEPQKQRHCHGSASTLVATIDEIRHGGSVCNLYNSTDALWDARSNSSMELQNVSFCCPTENITPQPYLSPEEVLFLSKLKHTPDKNVERSVICNRSNPEVIPNTTPYTLSQNMNETSGNDVCYEQNKACSNRPRRKFSLLREKFEPKQTTSDTKTFAKDSFNETVSANGNDLQSAIVDPKTENPKVDFAINITVPHSEPPVCHNKENVTPIVPSRIKHWNNFLRSQNSCNAKLSPEVQKKCASSADCEIEPNKNIKLASLKERRSLFLKQVLSPPKFQNWGKKSSLSPASKAVSA